MPKLPHQSTVPSIGAYDVLSRGPGGAISLVGTTASTLSTSSGSLTLDSATTLSVGGATATTITIGRTGQTTTVNSKINATEGIELTSTPSLGVSTAATAKLRYDNATTKLQVSLNGAAYVDVATGSGGAMAIGAAVASGTPGSILFVSTGGDLAQNNSKLFWDDNGSVSNLRIGSGAGISIGDTAAPMASALLHSKRVSGATQTGNFFTGHSVNNSAVPLIHLAFGHGTHAAPSVATSGDKLGMIAFGGTYDGTSAGLYARGAEIQATARENYSVSTLGTDLEFYTAGIGDSSTSLRLVLASDGGLELSASTAAVSAASTARLRYNSSTQRLQLSVNGGPYDDVPTLLQTGTTGAYTCPTTVAVRDAVYLSAADTVDKADADSTATMGALGFVVSKPTTTSCIIQYEGELTGFSGLTPGATYFVSTDAGEIVLSTDPGYPSLGGEAVQKIGVARNTTTLVIVIDRDYTVL